MTGTQTDHQSGSHSESSSTVVKRGHAYPQYLVHADRLLGLLGVVSLMVGGTVLIIQIWASDVHEWIWRLCGNLGALIAFCLLSIAVNQLLGRGLSMIGRLSHLFLIFCLLACLVVVSLVIWGQTDIDVAWRAIGTIIVVVIVSCIGIAISKMSIARHA